MTIKKIKEEMLAYRDFYGGDLLSSGEIEGAKTKKELAEIIDKHEVHMGEMLSDAESHLRNFKQKIGLTLLP